MADTWWRKQVRTGKGDLSRSFSVVGLSNGIWRTMPSVRMLGRTKQTTITSEPFLHTQLATIRTIHNTPGTMFLSNQGQTVTSLMHELCYSIKSNGDGHVTASHTHVDVAFPLQMSACRQQMLPSSYIFEAKIAMKLVRIYIVFIWSSSPFFV